MYGIMYSCHYSRLTVFLNEWINDLQKLSITYH